MCPSRFLLTRQQVRPLNGCAFWRSRWWIITFRVQNPPQPLFWGLNRHFKPNMRKIQIAISSDLSIRLTWNLTGSCGQQQKVREWSRMVVKQFQDGGRPPFWKSIYRHISVKNHRIFMKFCTQQQILNWMNVTWSKMEKLHWTDSEFDRTRNVFLVGNRSKAGGPDRGAVF